jgi:hypothetical protein
MVIPHGAVVGKAHALQQTSESIIGAQAVPARIECEPDEPVGAFLEGTL